MPHALVGVKLDVRVTATAVEVMHKGQRVALHPRPGIRGAPSATDRPGGTAPGNRRLERLLKAARLRVPACVEDIDYLHPGGLELSCMAGLASCDWIRQSLNLCITGPTGCGKIWLACAVGNQACRQGLSVRYLRVPRLFEQVRIAHSDGSYARLMNQLLKTYLLILDDWGMQKVKAQQRQDLMEEMEDRHGRGSTLIARQLPIEHWHDYISSATLADAILDRLLHGAHRLNLKGESLRKAKTQKTESVDPS